MINFELISASLPQLLHGALVSLKIAGLSLALGFVSGTLLGVLQSGKNSLVRSIITAYTAVIRGTPMLIQIVFLYYVLSLSGLHLSTFMAAVLAIGLNSGAYISQIIRAGISSVSKGQIEAARTLGINQWDLMRYIVLPQAFRVVVPALGNEAITLIKDSSLASWIGVVELYKEGQTIISVTYDALTVYCAVAALYLLMTTPLSYGVTLLEKRLNRHAQHNQSF